MASSSSAAEIARGARRKTALPTGTRVGTAGGVGTNENCEDGRDSGLSSESTTPTGGSPPARQPKIAGTSSNLIVPVITSRGKSDDCGRISSGRTSRLLRTRSGTDSPRSLDSSRTRQVASPLRPQRNIQSPSLDSGDEGSLRVERGTYQYMFQDIVSIKTMLLKLKRVLQESGENGLTRAETLNPFDNSTKNGLFYNLNEGGGTTDVGTSPGNGGNSVADELTDLRRQVVFLQGQLEDRDRTIQLLQVQMAKYQRLNGMDSQGSACSSHGNNIVTKETCNAATQTEKVRPVSAGPSLLQSLPQDNSGTGPLVSWSDSWNCRRPPSLAELDSTKATLRKSSDRSARLLGPRQERTLSRRNGHLEKPSMDSCQIKRTVKAKDTTSASSRSDDVIKECCSVKAENTPIKSSIPTPRRLTTSSTLIPRAARAVSATGRSHNP